MICSRNYTTYGPFTIKGVGQGPRYQLYRVLDDAGRRITEPIPLKQARKLSDLLNDVFVAGLNAELRIILPY